MCLFYTWDISKANAWMQIYRGYNEMLPWKQPCFFSQNLWGETLLKMFTPHPWASVYQRVKNGCTWEGTGLDDVWRQSISGWGQVFWAGHWLWWPRSRARRWTSAANPGHRCPGHGREANVLILLLQSDQDTQKKWTKSLISLMTNEFALSSGTWGCL